MKLPIPTILLALFLSSTAFAADCAYIADIRTSMPEDGILTLPLDENLEIHKPFDATVRYPKRFENGIAVEYSEHGIGLRLELWDFACEGETVSCKLDWQERKLARWHVEPIEWPKTSFVIPQKMIDTNLDSLDWAELVQDEVYCYRYPSYLGCRIPSPSDTGWSFSGKLGEWIELYESGEEAYRIPALRIRKAESRPVRRGGIWIKKNPGQEMPVEPTAEIIEYGTYGDLQETGIAEDGLHSHMLIGQKHLMTTDRIPRTDGTAFGYRFLPEGYFEENRITFVVRCPDILGIDGTREVRFDRTLQETMVNPVIGWLVEPEDSPGTYTFQIWADDRLLCEKSFLLE